MLENIEIKDYKCFKDFKLDGLSSINIISGGNNVGKTALLEAILLIKSTQYIRTFIQTVKSIFENRDLSIEDVNTYLETINLSFKKNNISTNVEHKFIDDLNDIEIKEVDRYRNNSEEFLIMYVDGDLQIIPFIRMKDNPFSLDASKRFQNNMIFINSSKPNNTKLTELYSNIQDLEIQEKFLNYLQIIDKNIIGIEPQLKERGKSFLRVSLQNPKQSLLSSELGEGTNRFIEILASLLKSSNSIVLIDEIENGIHYSKLKDIFKAIIEVVQKENIQLFVTTHDSETIEAFNKASREVEFESITSIKLFKNDNNTILPIIMNSDNLSFGIDIGEDFR